jgi:hypothetical protein
MGERIQVMQTRAKYPWEEWMDGSMWEIEQGVDFSVDIPVVNFVNGMHAKARKKGKRVRTHVAGKKLQFQFYVSEVTA